MISERGDTPRVFQVLMVYDADVMARILTFWGGASPRENPESICKDVIENLNHDIIYRITFEE